MHIFSIDSPLMQFFSKVADFMLMSLMLVIFSLPIVTIGPAMTALYGVLIKKSNGYEGSIIPLYWKIFKSNFRCAIRMELFFLPAAAAAGWLVYAVSQGMTESSVLLTLICFLPAVLLIFTASYAFPSLAQFDNTAINTVKNAFMLSIAYFPKSVIIAVLNISPVILAIINFEYFLKAIPILTIIGFSLIGWINQKILHTVFAQFISDK